MKNITDSSKKLAIKSELLRHMDTVKRMLKENVSSSDVKMEMLEDDIRTLNDYGVEPPVGFWEEWLA